MAGAGIGPNSMEKEQIIAMAEKEMEYRVDLFNRLTKVCFDKCIEKRYKESELNMGENSCIDRCVSKYWQNRMTRTIVADMRRGCISSSAEFSCCTLSDESC